MMPTAKAVTVWDESPSQLCNLTETRFCELVTEGHAPVIEKIASIGAGWFVCATYRWELPDIELSGRVIHEGNRQDRARAEA